MRKHAHTLLATTLLFLLSAWGGFSLDRERILDNLQLAALPLSLAVQTHDDLLAVDWARHFEAHEGVLGFRAMRDGRTFQEGGLRTGLDTTDPTPFRWVPPFQYRISWTDPSKVGPELRLVVVHRGFPGPLGWGALGAFLGLLGGFFVFWIRTPESSRTEVSPHEFQNTKSTQRVPIDPVQPLSASQPETPYLLLDPRWTIQGFSPDLPGVLGIGSHDLTGLHLLDLGPHPELLALAENAQKGLTTQAFNRFPGWSAETRPFPDGRLLLIMHQQADPTKP